MGTADMSTGGRPCLGLWVEIDVLSHLRHILERTYRAFDLEFLLGLRIQTVGFKLAIGQQNHSLRVPPLCELASVHLFWCKATRLRENDEHFAAFSFRYGVRYKAGLFLRQKTIV